MLNQTGKKSTTSRNLPPLLLVSACALALIVGCHSRPALAQEAQAPSAALASVVVPTQTPMGKRLMAFLQRVDTEDLSLNPQARLSRGDFSVAGEYGDLISERFFALAEAQLRTQLRDAKAIDRTQLNTNERIAYDTWTYLAQYTLKAYTDGHSKIQRQLPVDHLFGHHISFQQMASGASVAPFATLKDYEDGLARLDGFVVYLDRAVARMREGLAAKRVQPRVVTQQVISQLTRIVDTALDESPFLAPLKSMPDAIPLEDRARLNRAYRERVEKKVFPAVRRMRDFMAGAYLQAGRDEKPGLAGMPGGAALYEYVMESFVTVPMRADEVHQLGLSEVARIRGEMDAIRREVGFDGALPAFFEHLRTDRKYRFASRDAAFAFYRELGERVDAVYPRLFKVKPNSTLEIKAYPPEQETSGGGAYYLIGSPDGARPGTFFLNLSDLTSQTKPRATALYLHEAVPGHHVQGSLAQENTALPPVLRFTWNPGYGEGWALYAEWLGYEMGLYTDPIQRFGRLDMEIFRAARLVVDSGLHAKGWSRDQAIRYLLANTSLNEGLVKQEVDRYIVWPGQAVSYKVGEIFIRRLRSRAEKALGERFDVRAFHDQVLNTGALPLRVLERKIDDWIAGQSTRSNAR